ncbi:flagellar protein FliT [Sedimenticola sp.]|uniref:flagellar protein FliT n=1 Tax=Sedimenticola sp. TaxID=1940285 RepID=UPI003D12CC1E
MLDQIVLLSQKMLSLAQQGEWDQLTALQQLRDDQIENCFPLDPHGLDERQVSEQIRTILALDKQILQLAGDQQMEIRETLGKLSQGRVATKAYWDTSRR